MGITRLLDISRRSLRTLDGAMSVVGQNVANAGNENYVRQRVTFMSESVGSSGAIISAPQATPTVLGVKIQNYERLREHNIESAYRNLQLYR